MVPAGTARSSRCGPAARHVRQLVEVVGGYAHRRLGGAVDRHAERRRPGGRRRGDQVDARSSVAEQQVRARPRHDLVALDVPPAGQHHGVGRDRPRRAVVVKAARMQVLGVARRRGRCPGRSRESPRWPTARSHRARAPSARCPSRPGAGGCRPGSGRRSPRRSAPRGRRPSGRSGSRPASTGWPTHPTCRSCCRPRPGSRCRAPAPPARRFRSRARTRTPACARPRSRGRRGGSGHTTPSGTEACGCSSRTSTSRSRPGRPCRAGRSARAAATPGVLIHLVIPAKLGAAP